MIDTNIKYTGNVKISVKNGKSTISSREIHNTGTLNLFRFLANCLKGEFNYSMVPCKIRLFGKSNVDRSDVYTDPASWVFDANYAACSYIYINSAAVSDIDSVNNIVSVKYVFRIPYSVISADKIYKLGLYANSPNDAWNDIYAYIGLGNEDNTDWKPIEITDTRRKFALEIEWTLTLQNNN